MAFAMQNRWWVGVAIVATLVCGLQSFAEDEEIKVSSNFGKIGETATDFTLTDTDGVSYTLSEQLKEAKLVVLEWYNPHCVFTRAMHTDNAKAAKLKALGSDDVVCFAVNSTGVGFEGFGLFDSKKAKKEIGIPYPILLNESSTVGLNYGVTRSSEFVIVDAENVVRYRGAFDNGRPVDHKGYRCYVQQAVEQLLADKEVLIPQTKVVGSKIKFMLY